MRLEAAQVRVTVLRSSAPVQLGLEWLDEHGRVLLVERWVGRVGVGDSLTFDTHPDLDVE